MLGRNGAGETTLVGVCTAWARPTAGIVRLAGLDVCRQPSEVKRRIGVVAQHNTLERSLRVGDVLYWHCRYFNLSRRVARTRAGELLELFELSDRARERIFALSGGLARRLQLAAAVAHDPQVVFLDEPTTGLDIAARQILWQRIRDLAGAGACVLLTTHYLEEADQLSTRLVVLDRGRVIAHGTPDQLRDRIGADTLIRATVARPDHGLERRLSLVRSNSQPSSFASRVWMVWLTRAGVISSRSAARPKCSSSASVRNTRISRSSTAGSVVLEAGWLMPAGASQEYRRWWRVVPWRGCPSRS
ncbi:MAG: ATP-binding cassette domain-containing protein [Solirubrobacterales bacterium]|nr:ATP-binding cassette domain-containing protein [Solirubrobacterales bacterium]